SSTPSASGWRRSSRRVSRPRRRPRAALPARLPEATKRDRVAQLLDRGDAVLPAGARGAAQQIRRSRLRPLRIAPPSPIHAAPEPEQTRGRKRDPDDVVEDRLVAMPADRCTRTVLRDERLGQGSRSEPREFGRALAQRQEKGRNGIGRKQPPLV